MGDLKITQRRSGPVIILDLEGHIRLGQGNIDLHRTLHDLVENGARAVILNLEKVTTIDSSGLGELVAGYSSLEKVGGELKLVKLTERVTELMMITKLLTVFDVHDSETSAVYSFAETFRDLSTGPLEGPAITAAV